MRVLVFAMISTIAALPARNCPLVSTIAVPWTGSRLAANGMKMCDLSDRLHTIGGLPHGG
jgi:hypothetical protein